MSNSYFIKVTVTNTFEAETPEEAIEQMRDYLTQDHCEFDYENESTGERGTL